MIFKDVYVDGNGDYQFSMSLTDDETRFLVSLALHVLMETGSVVLEEGKETQEIPLPQEALEMIADEAKSNETAH